MPIAPTERTKVRRLPARASYERELIDAVVDEALSCHVGFAVEGRSWVVPTIHARIGDRLYLHGAVANHMLGSLAGGVEACITITIIDGLVLARSAFHHSMNYRSVMIFGRAMPIDDPAEKKAALAALVEHVVPGRTADAREPSVKELRTTLVLGLSIAEASAKMRTGGPIDDDEDLDLPVWAGLLPVATVFGEPLADTPDRPLPDYVRDYRRP